MEDRSALCAEEPFTPTLEDMCSLGELYVFYVVFRSSDALIIPCTTQELAEKARYAYVCEHWAERFPDEPVPEDPDEAWARYREDCEEYEIGITTAPLVIA